MNKSLTIIGGGAAGMMAAVSAKKHHPNLQVRILDRTFALGRKILVCGAGRCNITNINLQDNPAQYYYGDDDKSLVENVFKQFGYQDIVSFFNELGIDLYVERKTDIGKLFPVTDQAKTVTELLLDELQRLDVEVLLNTQVVDLQHSKSGWEIKTKPVDKSGQVEINVTEQKLTSDYVIISAGGRTYPALGSNGSGYDLVHSLGHTVIDPVPSAVPLTASDKLCHLLQNSKVDCAVTSFIDGKAVKTRADEVMFTNYGLSGPAILNISREISVRMNREHGSNVEVALNFFPEQKAADVPNLLQQRWNKRPNQLVNRSLYGLFPNKVADAMCQLSDIPINTKGSELTKPQIDSLLNNLTNYRMHITGTRSWNEAEFTAGGVTTTELNGQSLSSKLQPNLYLCGEILNVDGDVGGFNLSWAWVSGFVAGKLQ